MTNLTNNSKGYFVEPGLLGARLDASYYTPDAIQAEQRLVTGEQSGNFNVQPLEDICSYIMDFQAFSIYNFVEFSETYKDGWIEFLRVQDLNRGFVDTEKVLWTSPQSHELMKKSVVQPGDILLSIIGTLGVATRWTKGHECNSNQCIAKIRLKPQYDPGYLVAALNSQTMQILIHRDATGTVQKGLSLGGTRRLRLPLPDPKIQAYIGDKVRLAEKCREEAEIIKRSAQVLLDEILNLPSIDQLPQMQTNWWVDPEFAYSDRFDPNYYQPRFLRTEVILGPESSKFSEIVVNAKYGASVPADYKEEGIPFIRGTDLLQNRIDLSNLHYLDSSLAPKVKSAKVKAGDVLLTRSGTVGIAAAINEGLDNFAFGSFMIKLRFKESISPVYAAAFLNSPYGITQIERQKNGAVQQNINLEEIDRLLLPLLPTDQQKKISYLWAKWNLFLDYSQRLINQALSDIEKLIEGEMEIEEILLGKKKSLSWDDIEEEINGQLINYV